MGLVWTRKRRGIRTTISRRGVTFGKSGRRGFANSRGQYGIRLPWGFRWLGRLF